MRTRNPYGKFWEFCGFIACLICTSVSLWAQTTGTGNISGTITDATGAVVPGAQIVATQTATGISHTANADSKGYFVLSSLQIGEYDVKVSCSGFSTVDRKGIVLTADTTVAVNITLSVGATTQTITVTGESPALQTESGAVNTLVTGRQVQELALNGRNFTQLLTLGPGVNSAVTGERMGVGQEGNPQISVNGGRINDVEYTYDGILAMDTGGNRGLDLFPTMEAIDEVQIHKSNYTADTGSYGYGQVNLVTKSGGQQYHGALYEANGNAALDGRNFFSATVSPFNQNMFGYTIGGPVFHSPSSPRHDKLFFFWSEGWNWRIGPEYTSATAPPQSVFTDTTPTQSQRQGIFTTTITNPATGAPFPNDTIPSTSIDPNATFILNKFFPLPNRAGSPNYSYSSDTFTDWREELGRVDYRITDKMSLMARYAHDNWWENESILVGTYTDFPTTPGFISKPGQNMVMALTNSFSPRTVNQFTVGFSRNHITTIPGADAQRTGLNIPTLFNDNNLNIIPSISISGFAGVGATGFSNNANNLYTYRDDFTRQEGQHTLKAGFESVRIQKFVFNPYTNQQGTFTFNGSITGNALADFLLGDTYEYTESATVPFEYLFGTGYEMYFQDDWKVRPNLTLNLGLREIIYVSCPDGYEKYNNISDFIPSLYVASQAPTVMANGRLVPGTGNPLNGIITPTSRGGLTGLDRALETPRYGNLGPRFGFAYSPGADQKTVVRGGYGIFYHWDNDNQQSLSVNPPFSKSASIFDTSLDNPSGGTGASFPAGLNSEDPYYLYPQVQQWSLTVARELPTHTVLSVGYVGNHAGHLDQSFNINQPQPNLPVANGTNLSTVVPFLGYGSIAEDDRNSSAEYNGLQVDARHHFAQGFSFEVAYTWSKDRCWQVGQDTWTQQDEPGLCSVDQPQNFMVNYVYQLPFYKNQAGAAGKLLGGWQVSGITAQASGYPFTISEQGDRSGTGNAGRPNWVGPLDIQPKNVSNYFSTAAFALQPLGEFGNEGAYILRGPGRGFWNFSFTKNTTIPWFQDKKATLKFRADLYNAFNQVSFNNVGTTYASATFGQLTGALDPRDADFELEILF